jgi:hypothetical protein
MNPKNIIFLARRLMDLNKDRVKRRAFVLVVLAFRTLLPELDY